VLTQNGSATLQESHLQIGTLRVRNFEVFQQHNFLVGKELVVVHNGYIKNKYPLDKIPQEGFSLNVVVNDANKILTADGKLLSTELTDFVITADGKLHIGSKHLFLSDKADDVARKYCRVE
jgi:hypothetical protein